MKFQKEKLYRPTFSDFQTCVQSLKQLILKSYNLMKLFSVKAILRPKLSHLEWTPAGSKFIVISFQFNPSCVESCMPMIVLFAVNLIVI